MNRIRIVTGLSFMAMTILISSCSKEDDQMQTDRDLIEAYLADNNLIAQSTQTGLFYVIDDPGTSDRPTLQDQITIAYTGYLLNGQVFDSSLSATFPLANLIEGWKQGIPLFGRGGKGKLILPSHLGYGNRALPGIPPNSVLVFDIHLINF